MAKRASAGQERRERAERMVRNRPGRSSSRVIELVAKATLLPNLTNLGHLLIAVSQLSGRVDWLKAFLIHRLGDAFEAELAVALREEAVREPFSPAGDSEDNWAIVTLHDAGDGPLADELSTLAALFLAALIDASSGLHAPAQSHISDLAAVIRAIRRDPARHPLRRLLPALTDVSSIGEAVDRWEAELRRSSRPKDVDSASDWNRVWVPWGRSVVEGLPAPKKALPAIPRRRPPRRKQESKALTQFETGLHVGIAVGPLPSFKESPEEHTSNFICVARAPDKALRTKATVLEERRLCFQSIHHLNQALHPEHIATISKAELEFLLPHYEALYSAARKANEWDEAAAIVVEELVLATGRPLPTIVSIPIISSDVQQLSEGQDLVLCLTSGELIQRPLRPDGGVMVGELGDAIVDTSADLRLRLPPTLVAKIRKVQLARPALVVRDWFTPGRYREIVVANGDARSDPGNLASIRDLIVMPAFTPAISGSLSRLRNWLSCRVNQASNEDLSATMTCSPSL